jgi:hypothetical protein
MRMRLGVVCVVMLASASGLVAWGERGHYTVNRAAVRAIPDDGPVFLRAHEDWIVHLSVVPDAWRRPSEPFLKILEDPNHGWFREQFAFMTDVPRSRYEFVLALDAEHRRLVAAGDAKAAALTNVRWTGTLPYAAVESYERMVTGMRRYRDVRAKGGDTKLIELEVASYLGRLGHYIADGAMPLHDSVHHDGWQGANPNGYTTDPRVHGRFESQFVDAMALTSDDVQKDVPAATVLADPFDAVIAHLDDAATRVEEVYQLDKSGALADAQNAQARRLVLRQITRAAAMLRDLAHTAWVRSGETPTFTPADNPILQTHPHYNPATGSAPAPRTGQPAGKPTGRVGASEHRQPLAWLDRDPVRAKNFPLFALLDRHPAARTALADVPALRALLDERRKRVASAAETCAIDLACHVAAFTWSAEEIGRARQAIVGLARGNAALKPLVDEMRGSGVFVRDRALEPEALLARAWEQAAAGLNNVLAVYGRGEKPRYPAIDAVSYDVTANPYRGLVNTAVGVLNEGSGSWTIFYEPTLAFASTLLDVNRRDEAGRFEPLHLGENAAAYGRIGSTAWSDYPYTVIVVPGAGPDRPEVALDPQAKMRVALAARRYHERKAPFVLVSGGYVHPNQTPFNEALEMKRSLVRDFHVPEHAVLIDPHARHTTTNLRNAARIFFRYGIPTDRLSLITTDQYQSEYISGTVFAERCDRELGYRPYELKQRLSRYDLEWLPRIESLHADPTDPLDP